MKKIGEFWLPDVDLQIWRRFGKTRRKTIERFTGGGPKLNDLKEVLALIPAGRIAIDGGANVGAYARILAAHFDVVHAFEPAPDTFAALQRNIQEWGLTGRVILHNKALAERVDSVALSLKRGGALRLRFRPVCGVSSFGRSLRPRPGGRSAVPGLTGSVCKHL